MRPSQQPRHFLCLKHPGAQTRRLALLTLSFGLTLLACEPTPEATDAGPKVDAHNCQAGSLDCECLEDSTCLDDDGKTLSCVEGLCVLPVCTAGELGCDCLGDGSCTGDDLECNTEMICQQASCTAGSLDCSCRADESCDLGLQCGSRGVCVEVLCPLGSEGCPCNGDGSCGLSASGELLQCSSQEGLCEDPLCPLGSNSCACKEGFACAESGDVCQDGYCMTAGCTPGNLGCSCSAGSCDPGGRCLNNRVCVDATGFAGGPCDEHDRCRRGNRCQDDVCVPCRVGAQACGCNEDGACNEGLECEDSMCIATTGFAQAESPDFHCYTPCGDGFEDTDGYRPCSSEGLMEGCLAGLECVAPGQCVPAGEGPKSCQTDIDCPDFHSCLRGQCRSNCQSNDDCLDDAVCSRHVCRKNCDVVTLACPGGYFCAAEDGNSGVCLPVAETPSDASMQMPREAYSLSNTNLELTENADNASFTITNNGPGASLFRLRRLYHRYYDAMGALKKVSLDKRRDVMHSDPNACTPGTHGCACREVNGDQICAALPSGMSLNCDSDNRCHLPTCNDGDLGCYCEGNDCRQLCESPDCPLFWMDLGLESDSETQDLGQTTATQFSLEAGASLTVKISNAANYAQNWWDGAIEVENGDGLRRQVQLHYSARPDGAWNGEIYYFGDFRVDATGLQQWQSTHDEQDIDGIKNAFVQAWANFRAGHLSFDRFQALLTATRTESWRSAVLAQRCGTGRVCYPARNADGYEVYTYDPDQSPVPSGVVQYPFAMNIHNTSTTQDDADYGGRIVSNVAMQYAGNPSTWLRFASSPTSCDLQSPAGCLSFIQDFGAEIAIGGRYISDSCAARYSDMDIPWLIPGFDQGVIRDPETGQAYRHECRDKSFPVAVEAESDEQINASLAGANSFPDGRARWRSIEFVDGALINTNNMFILFRERIHSLVDDDPSHDLLAYGYMMLKRSETAVADEDYIGSPPPSDLDAPPSPPSLTCDSSLLEDITSRLGVSVNDLDDNWDRIAAMLLQGQDTTQTPTVIQAGDNDEAVHVLCEETNLFDAGELGDDNNLACPAGSAMHFFTVDPDELSDNDLRYHDCRNHRDDDERGCKAVLNTWDQRGLIVQMGPVWRCTDNDRAYCNDDPYDPRVGKDFYKSNQEPVAFMPLRSAVGNAFRYRTRFQNRQGSNLGFVPSLCVESSEVVPYCYDPDGINESSQRIDCLIDIYINHYAQLSNAGVKQAVGDFLKESFSYSGTFDEALGITVFHSGFEKLYAELLIMLGDDGFTKALSSRFDLARMNVAAFEGSLLEPGGINLSGIAGAEMYNLYQSEQYQQMVLERFFKVLPAMQKSIDGVGGPNFVTQGTVVEYLGRAIRAATQKSRAWSEISKRYQNFNRPDLARLVIERGYTAAYLESVILTNTMQNIVAGSAPEDIDQIVQSIRKAQISFRVALTQMRSQYETITNDINYFGFDPDYIPFPATESAVGRDNALEVILNRAWQRLNIAQTAEDVALQTSRSFDTDAASFQSELIRVENNYEGQLSELCGTFEAEGRVYPAIRKYAYLDTRAKMFGDPCGLMQTGRLFQAMGNLDISLTNLKRTRVSIDNTLAEAQIEKERIEDSCDTIDAYKKTFISLDGQMHSIQEEIDKKEQILEEADRIFQMAESISALTACTIGMSNSCPTSAVAMGVLISAYSVREVIHIDQKIKIRNKEKELRALQTDQAALQYDMQCDMAEVDSKARVKSIMLRLTELEVDLLRGSYEIQQALSQIKQLRQQATRIEAEMDESQQLTINTEAARNDPNVRIYRNDAVINADSTFYSAVREVYKATKVFEYYTSQSYRDAEQMFLIRMVTRGDFNLQNYLINLEDAYRSFEDSYGLPDSRVERLSLRDDILQVPYVAVTGAPYSQAERINMFREKLSDGSLLDENGYLTVPFHTDFDRVSPLTRNHKISFMQANIIGSDYGDQTGRVYLRMKGTSAIRSVTDDIAYYTFPERTAVINTSFNSDRNAFEPSVYKSYRFADRPYVNTNWEFVLNQLDEYANQDISLQGLTDIWLYIYYTDFTTY